MVQPLQSQFARILLSLATVLLTAASLNAEIVLDFTGVAGSLFQANATFGFSFEVTHPMRVSRLGFFDDFLFGGAGLNHNHLVRVWTDDQDRQLLASAVISNSSTAAATTAADGQWLLEEIDPIVLRRGHYVIGADDPSCGPSDCDRIRYLTTATTLPGITLTTVRNASPPGFPAASTNDRDDGYFGPTLDATLLPRPDFNLDDRLTCLDVDALVAEIAAETNHPSFDMTGDDAVDGDDLNEWLVQAGAINLGSGNAYLPGDANLDGAVDGTDFVLWNEHKFTATAAWCSGDFNADGSVDGADFIHWNTHKFTTADRPTNAVPEPASNLLMLALLVIAHATIRVPTGIGGC
jgi:hypothetical protein